MSVKLAIHERDGSFSERWLEVCKQKNIDHEVVDCYDSDILSRLAGFDGLLWHLHHAQPVDMLMGKNVISAAEMMGLIVFPSRQTFESFDDKVAQKYILESIDAPLAPTTVFYSRDRAEQWLASADFPLVAKLSRGAGSQNVRLLKSPKAASSYVSKAFGKGFKAIPGYFSDLSHKVSMTKKKGAFREKIKRAPKIIGSILRRSRMMPRERGYVLFQKFCPGNKYDTRVTVVGDRAWGYTRDIRPDDWRASGSGLFVHDQDRVDRKCVEIAFQTAKQLGTQSLAVDFVTDENDQIFIIEISYAYVPICVYECPGYWRPDMSYVEGHNWPQDAILDDLIVSVQRKKESRSPA